MEKVKYLGLHENPFPTLDEETRVQQNVGSRKGGGQEDIWGEVGEDYRGTTPKPLEEVSRLHDIMAMRVLKHSSEHSHPWNTRICSEIHNFI